MRQVEKASDKKKTPQDDGKTRRRRRRRYKCYGKTISKSAWGLCRL